MKAGDKVVCLIGGEWRCDKTLMIVDGPQKDEIITIAEVQPSGDLVFEEYPCHDGDGYFPTNFRKVEPQAFTNKLTKTLADELVERVKKKEYDIERVAEPQLN